MRAEADLIRAEGRERHRNDGKAPRAEALLAEVTLRGNLPDLQMWLGMLVEVGQEVTPDEEAHVWRALGESAVALPELREETVRRAMREVQDNAAQSRTEREPMNVNDAFPSNYIKASDLGDKRVLVTIDRVEMETLGRGADKESKPVVYFQGKQKGLVLNKTNSKKIHDIVGSWEDSDWVGHQVVIYATETEFGGDTVSCIRILPPPKSNGGKPAAAPPPPPKPAEEFHATDDDVPF